MATLTSSIKVLFLLLTCAAAFRAEPNELLSSELEESGASAALKDVRAWAVSHIGIREPGATLTLLNDDNGEVLGEFVGDKYGQGVFPGIPETANLRIKYSFPGSLCNAGEKDLGTRWNSRWPSGLQVVFNTFDAQCCQPPCSSHSGTKWISDDFDPTQSYPVKVRTEEPGMTVEMLDPKSCSVIDTAQSDRKAGRATFERVYYGSNVIFRGKGQKGQICDKVKFNMEDDCTVEQVKSGMCEVTTAMIPACIEAAPSVDKVFIAATIESLEELEDQSSMNKKFEAAKTAALPHSMTEKEFDESYVKRNMEIIDGNGNALSPEIRPDPATMIFPITLKHTYEKRPSYDDRC